MSEKKDKPERPFYELPAHIKPCSKIIQETRLQLCYKGKLPSTTSVGIGPGPGGQGDGFSSRYGSASSQSRRNGQEYMDRSAGDNLLEDYFDVSNPSSSYSPRGGGGGGLPGIRPVHTQRPKTGTDHDIWGVSSRKRPPSAITLSRLSLEDFEEEPVTSPTTTTPSLSRIASAGLGKPIKIRAVREKLESSPMGMSAAAEDISIRASNNVNVMSREMSGKSIKQVEETTQRIKGLSVSVTNSSSTTRAATPLRSQNNEDMDRTEGLIPAVNYLHTLVNNAYSSPEERPLKSEVIAALQQVKSNVGEIQDCPGEVKHRLLKLVFKLVERNQHDEDVVFWASFVLLHCRIMGNNLTTVFKMVFKASRSKEYWVIIQETEYLDVFMESFGQICPLTQTESMIYGYGTLKFICMEKNVLTRIVQLNLIPIMTLHLKLLNYELSKRIKKASDDEDKESLQKGKHIPESIFNGVFQLTSILRSVVGEESSLHSVVTSGLLEELCNSLEWTVEDIDILSNIVRILSVVSGDTLCCQVIASNQTFVQSVVTTIQMWHSKDDVVVRLTYCLGNLLAHCENMRIRLFEEPSCYNMILHLISYYLEKSSPISEDILIKTIRILANWSLNPIIGRDICDDPQISHVLNTILSNKGFSDELLTCVISTLNNTTFYKDYSSTDLNAVQTAEYLFEYLTWKNLDGRTEVMKVLGNLTRNPEIREAAAEHVAKLLESLVEDEKDEELLCATVGVLMNIIVETRASEEFLTHQGIDHLLRLMRVKNDLVLNLMICQFLWNIQISNERLKEEGKKGDVSLVTSNPINTKQRLEIRNLIRKKLENLSQSPKSTGGAHFTDFPYLDLEPEMRPSNRYVMEQKMEDKYENITLFLEPI
ncbi:unnamed protein product [Allacma fusca]|uniref:Armadillo repeat-containing protein 2 n=1 Tax=Allacma fusca TaxID=39272 RepID=A0A8J2NWE4_9HEXA|nr:unnamed protein product [Allacma fusca]